MKTLLIVGAGRSYPDKETIKKLIKDEPFILSVDGGYDFLSLNDIRPDLFLGDFDSISNIDSGFIERMEAGGRLLKYPVKKDMTDMELAINWAYDKGFKKIYVLGALGTRMDHGLININLISFFTRKGLDIKIYSEHNIISYLCEGSYRLDLPPAGFYTSFIAYPSPVTISLKGFEYNLDRAILVPDSSLAISNHIIDEDNLVTIEEAGGGGVICLHSLDK